VLAACSPVKMGAAAVVGDQRITVASLDTQVSNLQTAAKPYAGQMQLTQAQMPAAVLGWLIRFAVRDQMASEAGVTVTQAQVQVTVAQIGAQAQQAASSNGQPTAHALDELLVANGVPPSLLDDLGRYQAQEIAFVTKNNGGKLPTSQSAVTTAQAQVGKADCRAAKGLNIQVSPQFGRLDYTQYSVVPAADTLSAPSGKPSPAPTSGLTPAC
jgi:hypothetical protein